MRAELERGLKAAIDARLVDELLDAFDEAKRNFHLGGLRLSAVEAGRFCEAAFRILEFTAFGSFTVIGKQLDSEGLIRRLGSLPANEHAESIRLHIPRALRVVYDIRNKRDAAHLADGIEPNVQDATLVVGTISWVLAEFVRLNHDVAPEAAQQMIEELVMRQAPIVQNFEGHLKVLDPLLKASEVCIVLLYQRGPKGATFEELRGWVAPTMRANLKKTLNRLEYQKTFVHCAGSVYKLTNSGELEVERRRLLERKARRES